MIKLETHRSLRFLRRARARPNDRDQQADQSTLSFTASQRGTEVQAVVDREAEIEGCTSFRDEAQRLLNCVRRWQDGHRDTCQKSLAGLSALLTGIQQCAMKFYPNNIAFVVGQRIFHSDFHFSTASLDT